MGMVVRTNTMAMNAYRQLGVNNTAVGKSLEKLSSGFRINRAADDASGLAISEKMKAQIKGLEQASANSQDGISLIQTAEGATTEIHNMLNRMTELATKSANGTIQDPVDREAIQQEVNDLNAEISRIAQSTNFNGINLLDGSLGQGGQSVKMSGTAAGAGVVVTDTPASKGSYTANALAAAAANGDGWTFEVSYKDKDGNAQTKSVTFTGTDASAKANADAAVAALNADNDLKGLFKFTADATGKITAENLTAGKGAPSVDGFKAGKTGATSAIAGGAATAGADRSFKSSIDNGTVWQAGDKIEINGKTYTYTAAANGSDGKTFGTMAALVAAADKNGITITAGAAGAGSTAVAKAGSGLKLQVGDTNAAYNHVSVSIDDLSAGGLGLTGLDVSTQDAAGDAIDVIKNAINKVSTNRANLGSLQNRLEYTINNLDTTAENMTAANSRIRDTDMAKEMMNYTKMNILTQSAQAMLAQANQQPQAILQLLQ